MIVEHDPNDVVGRLVRWAGGKDPVRAVLLTSTRARPGFPVDKLSDYDVVLVVGDIRPFFEDRAWLEDFGEVLVAYWDGIEQTGNVVQRRWSYSGITDLVDTLERKIDDDAIKGASEK